MSQHVCKFLAEEFKKLELGKGLDAWAAKKVAAIRGSLTELVGDIGVSPDGAAVLPDPSKAAAMFRPRAISASSQAGCRHSRKAARR